MKKSALTRRQFMQTSAGLAAAASSISSGFTIVKAESVRGTAANSMVEVGWIGLGGRGTRDAYLLEKTGKAKIVAVGDYFQYRIDNLFKPLAAGQDPETVQRPALAGFDKKNAFVGVDAYKAVIGSKVDAILMATPPGFRPEHFKAAVAAKKHVFMEKPLAVDTWGCHVIDAAGKQATAQKLSVVVGLQRHYSKAYRRCKELIDSGAIGDIVMAHSAWDTGDLWPNRRAKPSRSHSSRSSPPRRHRSAPRTRCGLPASRVPRRGRGGWRRVPPCSCLGTARPRSVPRCGSVSSSGPRGGAGRAPSS